MRNKTHKKFHKYLSLIKTSKNTCLGGQTDDKPFILEKNEKKHLKKQQQDQEKTERNAMFKEEKTQKQILMEKEKAAKLALLEKEKAAKLALLEKEKVAKQALLEKEKAAKQALLDQEKAERNAMFKEENVTKKAAKLALLEKEKAAKLALLEKEKAAKLALLEKEKAERNAMFKEEKTQKQVVIDKEKAEKLALLEKEKTKKQHLKTQKKQEEIKNKTQKNKTQKNNPNNEKSVKKNNKNIIDDELPENAFLLKHELDQHNELMSNTDPDYLYPDLNDPNFNIKIAEKKEFNDTQYDGTIHDDIEKQADKLCHAKFELLPHQLFVKNFLSFQTPYNSLLLFFGLGTGKTCAAIGVAEETRNYMKQVNLEKKILVVASPNVRASIRLQLFDERKLELRSEEGKSIWNIESCVGNSLLKEINPTNLKGLTKESVKTHINALIYNYYEFTGYGKLGNTISETLNQGIRPEMSEKEILKIQKQNIRREFNNRLIIIDEVHNIRLTDDNQGENKKTGSLLFKVAQYATNLKFLFLSATPMFNSYKEIIWLTNLMNVNDGRGTVELSQIFEKDGNFRSPQTKPNGVIVEGGKELLVRKLTGYVSYIRGENPYAFPFRIYPSLFAKDHTFLENKYPTIQINKKSIDTELKYISVYLTKIKDKQLAAYQFIIDHLRNKSYNYFTKTGTERNLPSFENMDSFGYTILRQPVQALNIVYPSEELDNLLNNSNLDLSAQNDQESKKDLIFSFVGEKGLENTMTYKKVETPNPLRYNYEYRPSILEKYGPIFQQEHLYKYSAKMAQICESIRFSTGIVLIYSQYIDGGVVPMALALEEMGFSRYGTATYTKNLLKNPSHDPIDAIQLKTKKDLPSGYLFKPAKYIMITGNKDFSPMNAEDIKHATSQNNRNGEQVKVILISRTGSEGIDFKNIRQVHILEPWFNMNRIEQIIGRGVRNLSHCDLPFKQRNVEIYLHSTLLDSGEEEAADLYLYRFSVKKAIEIGKITRLMKETSIDCILNQSQQNFTVENMKTNVEIYLSSHLNQNGEQTKIMYDVGDRSHTELCDYMDSCEFTCSPNKKKLNVNLDTYNESFVKINNLPIIEKIRQLFLENAFYTQTHLIKSINLIKQYPIDQIFSALSYLIKNKNEYIVDKYGRIGNLINKDDLYVFQPIEINDETISIYDKTVPIEYKRKSFFLELPKLLKEYDKANKKDNGEESSIGKLTKIDEYYRILGDLEAKISIYGKESKSKNTKKISITESWEKNAGHVCHELTEQFNINNIEKYVIQHFLDSLSFTDKLYICDYLFSAENKGNSESSLVEHEIMEYFNRRLLKNNSHTAIVLADDKKYDIFIKPDKEESELQLWRKAESAEQDLIIRNSVEKFKREFIIEKKNETLHSIVGFMILFKDKMGFKIKIINNQKNNKGSYCFNAGKNDAIKSLNLLLGETKYNEENTKMINQTGLCIIFEILVRYYTDIKKDNKIYFIGPEQTIINGIPSFVR